jgi:MOSC domain-containing protein YiiM
VKEVGRGATGEGASLGACVATILELDLDQIPEAGDEDPVGQLRRWLAGLGLGLVPIDEPNEFSWPGPWVGRLAGSGSAVVMYGVPSGVVWDPAGAADAVEVDLDGGWVLSALDIALALPAPSEAPRSTGTVEGIFVAPRAGEPSASLEQARALAGRGLDGDRHVTGDGTFPSGLPGSALTLIEAEVCESFDPPLAPDEHRRNVVTRGIDLNALVGHDFTIGSLRCRGMRLCEPCTVVDRYASRPVLRPLVHRGGLRADILEDGIIGIGDSVGGY